MFKFNVTLVDGGSLVSHLFGTWKVWGSNPGKGDHVSLKINNPLLAKRVREFIEIRHKNFTHPYNEYP